MSAVVKLSPKMPGDFEMNGLDSIAEELVEDPKTLRMGVVWFDTAKTTVDTDTGDHVPTIRFRRFEPLGEADTVSGQIREAVSAAIEKRTGRTPIPFDIVEVTEDYRSGNLLDEE